MPLRIIIAGAGIAGLTAAIALAPSGHEITIVEKSKFALEVGAAFHLGPGSVRILRSLGVDISAMLPVELDCWHSVNAESLEVTRTKVDVKKQQASSGVSEPELMVHRVDAHNVLKAAALAFSNVTLKLGDGVESVDTSIPSATLTSGAVLTADLIIGADGQHSKVVEAIDPSATTCSPIGINMYRWMVPYPQSSPTLASFFSDIKYPTQHSGFALPGTSHFLVLYSCRSGSLVNCATFQPSTFDPLPEGDYRSPGTVADVERLMAGWPPVYSELARAAEDVKKWAVLSRPLPRTYVKGKVMVMGDAAHPTHPTHAAGANMGIEDAAVLGVVLDSTVEKSTLEERLALWNELRYTRSAFVKDKSEMIIGEAVEQNNMQHYTAPVLKDAEMNDITMEDYLWSADVVADAKKAMAQQPKRSDSKDVKV